MKVSLKEHGLRLSGSLHCSAGGQHDVPEGRLAMAVTAGGGVVECLKCNEKLVLEPVQ